jgi:uncharacterized damage-inducible protein DinB
MTGPMWHGPALAHVLDGVTPERAARRPPGDAHSIWEIVHHITVWSDIARLRLHGQATGDPTPEQDFPVVTATDPATWALAVDRLAISHRELAAATRELTDEQLDARVTGLDYTVETLLHGVVEHGAYHGGQIALLKKT